MAHGDFHTFQAQFNFQNKFPAGAMTFGLSCSGTATPKDFASGRFQRDQSGATILRIADS
jgi:hypothetical protein